MRIFLGFSWYLSRLYHLLRVTLLCLANITWPKQCSALACGLCLFLPITAFLIRVLDNLNRVLTAGPFTVRATPFHTHQHRALLNSSDPLWLSIKTNLSNHTANGTLLELAFMGPLLSWWSPSHFEVHCCQPPWDLGNDHSGTAISHHHQLLP